MFLQEFQITIQHIDGTKNVVADFLTRNPSVSPKCGSCNKDLKKVARCSILKDGGSAYEAYAQLDPNFQQWEIWNNASASTMNSGQKLFFRQLKKEGKYWYYRKRLAIPDGPLKTQLLEQYHDLLPSGHQGVLRSREKLSREYFWVGLEADMTEFVKSCDTCQRFQERNQKKMGRLKSLPIPEKRFQEISMDFCSVPKTSQGDMLFIIVDRLTKMVRLIQCFEKDTAETIAELFINNWYRSFGLPSTIVSDRDPKFTSRFWRGVCSRLGVKLELTTARHQNANGQAEITVRTVKRTAKKFLTYNSANWDQVVALVEFALNDSVSTATGFTPFFLTYGVHPTAIDSIEHSSFTTWGDWSVSIALNIREAKVEIEENQVIQKSQYDKRRRLGLIELNSKVLLESDGISWPGDAKVQKKLEIPGWLGPFEVIGVDNARENYRLRLPAELGRIHPVFHVSKLLPYWESDRKRFP